jgi:hypothetical protein
VNDDGREGEASLKWDGRNHAAKPEDLVKGIPDNGKNCLSVSPQFIKETLDKFDEFIENAKEKCNIQSKEVKMNEKEIARNDFEDYEI